MKQNRYSSEKKLFVCLILLILVCIILLIIKTYSTNHETKPTQIVSDEPIQEQPDVQTSTVSSQPEIVVKTEPEITVNHLNNLSDNEASFGELDVPIYKKGQKTLKLPLLIYHAFQTPIPKDDVYKLFSSEQKFDENVKTLIDAGYTFLTLEDIYKYNKGLIGLPEKNVTITMDDGWLGSYTEAFNVLKKYNIPATIFIVEDLVGTEGYFTWEQAKEMYDSGLVKIHVHGRKHISATSYKKATLIADYNHTHALIEEKLGAKVQKIMAYPAGKCSTDTIKWLKEAGFEVQVQTKYGTVNKSNSLDLTSLGRVRGERASGKSILNSIK